MVEEFVAFFEIGNAANRTSISSVTIIMSSISWFMYVKPSVAQCRQTMVWCLQGGLMISNVFWKVWMEIEHTYHVGLLHRGRYYRSNWEWDAKTDFFHVIPCFVT